MKIVFWICWLCDVFIIITLTFSILGSYATGIMDSKSTADIIDFLLIFIGIIALVAAAMILYKKRWQKTATLLASLPFLSLIFIFSIPIIAYLSGARMN